MGEDGRLFPERSWIRKKKTNFNLTKWRQTQGLFDRMSMLSQVGVIVKKQTDLLAWQHSLWQPVKGFL